MRDSLSKRLPFDQFQHKRLDTDAVQQGIFKAKNRPDVWMGDRGEHLRLAFEAGEPFGIRGKVLRKNLERDVAA
jgi:Flp pilus assembly protein CpaB